MKHHLLKAIILLSILVSLCSPISTSATTPDIGVCGVNLTWALDNQGTLTISGSGEMYGYDIESHAPWYEYRHEIQTVNILPGVKNIGNWAFDNCTSLTRVAVPDSVTRIGKYAFRFCEKLSSISIPDSVTAIDDHTFFYCLALADVAIPASVTHIEDYAFFQCPTLTTVKYEGAETEWNKVEIGDENDALKQAEIYYNITQPDAATKTERVNETFVVTPMGIPQNSSIVFACYRGNQLVCIKPHTYTGEESISFTADAQYDEVKIMAWETVSALRALGAAEAIAAE